MRGALAKHDFASVLSLLRQSVTLTQREIGEIVGIDQAVVSRIENGKQQVTHTGMLLRFIEGLRIPARFVFPTTVFRSDPNSSLSDKTSSETIDADQGIQTSWDAEGTTSIMEDWLHNADSLDFDRRIIREVRGESITTSAHEYSNSQSKIVTCEEDNLPQVTPPAMDYIEAAIDYLRRVDDMEGGNTGSLAQVHHHFLTAGRYLKAGMASNSAVARRLHNAVAQLAQIASWMCYDADDHGKAQRYFLTALHASYSSGDSDHGAYVLACQAYQTSYRGHPKEAVILAQAAVQAAKDIHPKVQAQVFSWSGHAFAAYGETRDAQISFDAALETFDSVVAQQNPPKWLYWVSKEELIAQQGRALVLLARYDDRKSQTWLTKANRCLILKAFPFQISYPRSGVYNSLWVVRNHVRQNNIEHAVELGSLLINHEDFVCSPRSASLLATIDTDLAERGAVATMPFVKDFRRHIIEVVARNHR